MLMNLKKRKMMNFQFNKEWTLFLDRDGVINERIIDDYVMDPKDLILTPNLIQALVVFTQHFNKIFVVSNQQCVGKGLCNLETIENVHGALNDILLKEKILISEFLVCPHKATDNCHCRKPKSGLALQAQSKYPDIDFLKSVMVGDMLSDMKFGKNLGMTTIYVGDQKVPNFNEIEKYTDYFFINLYEFAKNFQ
jgi:D-glycero-D-manno-heptose 1,7-bisphosphate phosphatase